MEIIDLIQDKIRESQTFDLLNQIDSAINDVNIPDSDMILLNIIREFIDGKDTDSLIKKLPNLSEPQLSLIYSSILDCCRSYFKSKIDLTVFLSNFFTYQELMYFDIDNLTAIDLSSINQILLNIESSINFNNVYDIELSCELKESVRESIIEYFDSKNMFDKGFIENVESASITRDILGNDAILESDNVSDKIRKLEEMDDQSITFLYSIFTGDYTASFRFSMRSELSEEVVRHPAGQISRYLSPISPEQQDSLLVSNNSTQSDVDQFWQSIQSQYGTRINENLLILYTKLFPINECRRLLTSLSNINIIKGINENYYMVSGKNLNNIKLLK